MILKKKSLIKLKIAKTINIICRNDTTLIIKLEIVQEKIN